MPGEGDYSFTTTADNGTRLVVDAIYAISNWQDGAVRSVTSQPVHLSAGAHKLTLEYYTRTGAAEMHLRWACGGCGPALNDAVVPSSSLDPAWLNQTSTVSPLGRVSFSHFSNPALGRFDYDLVRLGDGTNLITSYGYDSYGRITQKVMPKGNAGRTIDSNGTLQGAIDSTYATSWTYYAAGATAAPPAACGGGAAVDQAELLKSKSPHGIAATSLVYDAAGRAITETNGAGTKCFSYDTESRLTSEKAPGDAQPTTFSYDPAGSTRTVTDASGTVTSDYDEAGRLKRSIDSYGAEATFAYDADGNLVLRTSAAGPLTGNPDHTTGYGYDAKGDLTSVSDPAGRAYGFGYDRRGNLRWSQYPNGTFSWDDYNPDGSLAALYNRHGTLSGNEQSVPADGQASPLADYGYSYNLDGQKTQEVRSGGGLTTETTSYAYDSLGRLSQVTLPDGTVRQYSFDLDSNRSSIVENGATVASYSYDPATTGGVDQLTSVTQGTQTTSFAYSADGQTRQRGTDTLSWNGWGLLAGGTFNGSNVSYSFDPLGRRRQRTSGTKTTRYLFAGGDAPLYETDAAGAITETDIDGPQADLAHYAGPPGSGTNVSFQYYNGHGDLAAEADTSGTRTATYTYDPFGAPKQTPPANDNVERWTGRWDKKLDTTTGLIEMGARQYDPTLGRFLSADPIEGGSLNNYDYAQQDPVNEYDLTGQCVPVCVIVGVLVAIEVTTVAASVMAAKKKHHNGKPGTSGHTKGKRPSTKEKHEKAEARRVHDQGQTGGPRPPRKTFPRGKWRGKH